MQVASTGERKRSPNAVIARRGKVAVAAVPRDPELVIAVARQDYLDALPIAAAVICLDEVGRLFIDAANGHFRHLADWDEERDGKLIGRMGFLRIAVGDALADFLAGAESVREFESSDGKVIGGRHFTVRLSRLKPAPGVARRCLISLLDKTAQVETEKSLRAEMLRDSLTGLPNRLAFNERVEGVLGDPGFSDGSHGVLVVDMTRFSRINECMGAMAGDELLITFARRLFSALRAGDVLARTGGDEFGILIKLEKGLDDARQAAGRIKAALAAPFRLSELEIRVDCAVGCAVLTKSVEVAEEVLRNAQFALKHAKQTGHTEFYEPHQATAVRRRFSIETELRRAIDGGRLTLDFQPLIDLQTSSISGFEALARWEHEERGPISPTEFIPVAEESGLIVSLGRWALHAAVETLRGWDRQTGTTLPLQIAVNVSPIQIARDNVAAAVADAIGNRSIDGSRLTFELTESAIIQDPQRATKVLEALKGFDAKVAMDDFGTGYTSLAYLQRLPIDILKIDRSFVTGMLGDKDSTSIVRAILSLANALGMATTAEGIESAALAQVLTGLGCSHGQGFYFAEPLAPAAALDYWLSWSARST